MTQPLDWVSELLRDWAQSDWRQTRAELGLPTVSPSFSKAVFHSPDDSTSYSPAEIRAMAAAVEWLHLVHVEHYRVIACHFRPWVHKEPSQEGDDKLLLEAVEMLAKYIDEVLG